MLGCVSPTSFLPLPMGRVHTTYLPYLKYEGNCARRVHMSACYMQDILALMRSLFFASNPRSLPGRKADMARTSLFNAWFFIRQGRPRPRACAHAQLHTAGICQRMFISLYLLWCRCYYHTCCPLPSFNLALRDIIRDNVSAIHSRDSLCG